MKNFKRAFCLALSAGFTALCLCAPARAVSVDTLRVGLHYGQSALSAPQLQNFTGSGYQAGYFDDSAVFHSLLPLSQTKLVILKDANYALSGDNTYTESTSGAIGAYHIELPDTYASASAATAAAAQTVNGFVCYIDGAYRVRTGSYTSAAEAALAAGSNTVVGASPTGLTVVETGTSKILFEYDDSAVFGLMPQGDNPLTWCKGYKYYGGFGYIHSAGTNISVINYVKLDDYVKGVIPYEMSASWHVEALKAQAVCARSYALGSLDKHKSNGFDVCNTTDCQVYQGTNLAQENSDLAAEQTAGEYIAYNGEVVTAFFFSSDGGATEDSGNVWSTNLPYLKGKLDPYEDTENINKGVWSTTLSAAEVTAKLNSAGLSIGTVTSLVVTKTSDVGNVLEVTATDASGKTVTVTKGSCRNVFGLNSQRYTITGNGATGTSPTVSASASTGRAAIGAGILSGAQSVLSGTAHTATAPAAPAAASAAFTFDGRGWGHHVGMSQYGAKAMAQQGMTYDQILNFYYTDIEILK